MMDDTPRRVLCELIGEHGKSLCDDPRRCEALLRDLCPGRKREVGFLVAALKERVPEMLLSSQPSGPPLLMQARQAHHLQQELALTEAAARWAVGSWATALGLAATADADDSGSAEELGRSGQEAARRRRAERQKRQAEGRPEAQQADAKDVMIARSRKPLRVAKLAGALLVVAVLAAVLLAGKPPQRTDVGTSSPYSLQEAEERRLAAERSQWEADQRRLEAQTREREEAARRDAEERRLAEERRQREAVQRRAEEQRREREEAAQRESEERRLAERRRIEEQQRRQLLSGAWDLVWIVGPVVYTARLKMNGESGLMRVRFRDLNISEIVTVDQTMHLRFDKRGYPFLEGTNPRLAGTALAYPTYSSDNLRLEWIHNNEVGIVEFCDDNGSCGPVRSKLIDYSR